MKNLIKNAGIYFIVILSFIFQPKTYAQKFAGISSVGGSTGGGMAFRINADGSQFTDLKDMSHYPQYPQITLGSNGTVVFGVTSAGGANGMGTLFSMNIDGSNFKTLYTFDATTGGPATKVIQASDGMLYGTTKFTNIPPTIFKINPDGSGFQIVHAFSLPAYFTIGNLYESTDGKLYALTLESTQIISINKDGTGLTVVHDFGAVSGLVVYAPLIQDAIGNFYGVAPGGANNYGQIFKLSPDGTGFTDLFDFDSSTGQYPLSSLMIGSDGNLYGGTASGGVNGTGAIFSIGTNGTGFKKIYDLNVTDGDFFYQKLYEDGNGFLYGATVTGGAKYAGVIFKVKTDGTLYQKIYDFDNYNTPDGQYSGSFVLENNLLLGTNYFGATYGAGNIFTIQLDGTVYTDLYDFGGTDGSAPSGKLTVGKDSLLYGTTYAGGIHNSGTIFAVDGNGKNYTKIFDLGGSSGSSPTGGLTLGNDGVLYGTTSGAGAAGVGTLFKITPNGTSFTKLLDFNVLDGYSPYAPPIIGIDGNLYGTTYEGGSHSQGTIYSCNPDGSNFTKLLDINVANGASLISTLIQDEAGVLYGTSSSGGANYGGFIFSVHPDGGSFTILYQFDYNSGDGNGPYASLVLGQDGNLYGVTQFGGAGSVGIIFSLHRDGSNFKKLHDFQVSTGCSPTGSLIQLDNGLFYGITLSGGAGNSGTIFSIASNGSGYTDLYDFPSAPPPVYFIAGGPTLTLLKLRKQAINFNTIPETNVNGPAVTLLATASSGLPVSFSSGTSGLTQVSGNQGTILAPGKATIIASQSGDGVYDSASVQQSFCIDPVAVPSITISTGGSAIILTSSASSDNQWYLNSSVIPGATNSTLKVNSPGTYTVRENIDGCYGPISSENTYVITGLESSPTEVSLFPNPTKGVMTLNLSSFDEGTDVKIEIYNTLGILVNTTIVEGGGNAGLDASQISNGLYVLSATQAQTSYHTRFIKN